MEDENKAIWENEQEWRRELWKEMKEMRKEISGLKVTVAKWAVVFSGITSAALMLAKEKAKALFS